MIVKLTFAQYNELRKIVDERVWQALTPTMNGKINFIMSGPYIAWHQALEQLSDKIFNVNGTRKPVPRTLARAHKAISTELNNYDRHPGLRGWAMEGIQRDVLYGWELKERDPKTQRLYSPLPVAGRRFVVLCPEWLIDNEVGFDVTVWSPDESGPTADRLAEESLHLSLLR